jgi:probable rRNA maturation factor
MGRAEVVIQNPGRFPESGARKLRPWVEALVAELVAELAPDTATLCLRFTGDRAVRRLNRLYRGNDRPTDVLSFAGEDGPDGRHLGDVVVSVPTARRQAREHGHPVERELRRLVLHGVLHCLGHDHETDGGRMERLERRLRRRWLEWPMPRPGGQGGP